MDWKQVDRSNKDSLSVPFALWPVDLKLTHVDCNPGDTLVHFQGQYLTICELDYNILQVEIQNAEKTQASLSVSDFCLVEDVLSSRWYRGRVQNKQEELHDVFLLDYGNVLTVSPDHLAAISDDLLVLPPKIVCGFFANVLPNQECWDSESEKYFSSMIGSHIKGFIHGLLPYKVFLLEAPDITKDLVQLHLGRLVDTDSFLLLVEMLLEMPVQQSCQSVPDLLLEKQSAQEFSFKSSSLRGFENVLSLSQPTLAVGQKERARVTAAVNPELFYCQPSSVANDLIEMTEKLAIACESRTRDHRDAENLGLLCAVKGKDEKWHRGFVQCLPVSSQVRVMFVDYGYCEFVKVENVLQLPSQFLLKPTMAYPCSLSCLNDSNENTKCQQLAILKGALLGKEVLFTVDGCSKEKNVLPVTLSSVDELAQLKTVHFDELKNSDVNKYEHILDYYPECCVNKRKEMKSPEELFLLEEIQDGSVFEGYVEFVQNPNEFWIRTARCNDRFEDMMNKLTDYFSGLKLNEEVLEDPEPGVLCCAMYEQDLHYYRAIVVDILEQGAEVFFIDFGNTEKVPSMLIKKIPSQFAVEPPFVISCSLAHAMPLDDCWTMATNNFFRKAISNKAMMVHVIHKRNDTLAVELCEKGTEKCESITSLMIRENLAGYWNNDLTATPVDFPNEKNKTPQKKMRKSCKRVTQKPDVRRLQQQQFSTQKVVVEKQTHTDTREPNAEDIFRPPKIQLGSEISVLCTHVTSPSDFWCQNKKHKDDLDRLMKKLQDFYQTHSPVFLPHSLCCAVKFHQDNMWYRGLALEVSNEDVEVILVDYGMVVKDSLKNIRALLPEFIELETQAFRCTLYNLVEPVQEKVWSKEACTFFKDFVSVSFSNLTCSVYSQLFVVNKGICNVVDLHTPHQKASSCLVEKGAAVEISYPKQLVPSAQACSFVYSSFNISVGSEELVYATHVDGPWEIYLQLDKNSVIIDELMESIQKESEQLLSQAHSADNTGPVCLAKYFGDTKWYRAISWPAQSSQHLNVLFVDYGNKQVAEKDSVLPIPRKSVDLLSIPMQALRCSLSDVPEREHLPEVNAWLRKTIINRALQAKFVAKNNSGHFLCELFDGNLHINEKVKELFAIQGDKDAVSSGKRSSDCSKEDMNVPNMGKKFKTKDRGNVKTVGRVQGKSHCRKASKVKLSHVNHNQNSHDQSKEMNEQKCKKNQISRNVLSEKSHMKRTFKVQTSVLPKMRDLPNVKIKPGSRGVGYISHCNSAERFFIQMEKDEQTILKIGEDLNSSLFTDNMQHVSEVNVGDLVAAKYEDDMALYRAVVTNIASSGVLTVEFVDYGNTATINKKNAYLLTSQFLSYARLSIPCTLSNPEAFQDTDRLMKEAHNKALIVEFVRNRGNAWVLRFRTKPLQESREDCPSDRNDNKIPASEQCESKQELNMTEVEAKNEEHNHGISQAEKSRMNEETRKNKETRRTTSKVVQKDSLGKKQKIRAADHLQKCNTNIRHKDTNKGQDEKQQNSSKGHPQVKPDKPAETCDSEKTAHSVSHNSSDTPDRSVKHSENESSKEQDVIESEQSVLGDTYTEDLVDEEDQVQHLFFAPVQMDVEYSGFAAAVITPGEFYIVLEDLLLVMNAVSNILEDLPEVLSSLPESHLICGTGCLVRCGEKNKWCRAELVQCDDNSVIINLVDYGHYAHIPRQDVNKLKKLPSELARLPKITYPCLLRGVKSTDGIQWSDSAVVFFQKCMAQGNLQIYFRHYVSDAQWEIDVVTEGRNIAKDLVDASHACYTDSMFGIRFQHRLGQLREHQHINTVACVPEGIPSNCKQAQWKDDAFLQGDLEMWITVDNIIQTSEEIAEGCHLEGETKYTFSRTCNSTESGQITHHDLSSDSSQCILM